MRIIYGPRYVQLTVSATRLRPVRLPQPQMRSPDPEDVAEVFYCCLSRSWWSYSSGGEMQHAPVLLWVTFQLDTPWNLQQQKLGRRNDGGTRLRSYFLPDLQPTAGIATCDSKINELARRH